MSGEINPRATNAAICEALGLDGKSVAGVTIRLRPQEFPQITVHRYVLVDEGQKIADVVERFSLAPKDKP